MKKLSLKSAAILTIIDASKMTPKGRKQIADWLRKEADELLKYGTKYSPKFRVRYLYR